MASAEEPCDIRISYADSEENKLVPVAHFDTRQASSAAKAYPTDRDALALPPAPATKWLDERRKVVLLARGHSADTVESEESDGLIPGQLMNKTTGEIYPVNLRIGDSGSADFADFNSTDDIILNTSTYARLGAYTVPDGFKFRFRAGAPVHVYIGDDTA